MTYLSGVLIKGAPSTPGRFCDLTEGLLPPASSGNRSQLKIAPQIISDPLSYSFLQHRGIEQNHVLLIYLNKDMEFGSSYYLKNSHDLGSTQKLRQEDFEFETC